MKNFFLVGMPGSGKSTTAKYISEHTDLNFIDLDVEIIASYFDLTKCALFLDCKFVIHFEFLSGNSFLL